jgi:thymidine phosphorylase
MFALRRIGIDTHHEHVVMIHERTVEEGALGFKPLDRVRVIGSDPESAAEREITGVLNFCTNTLLAVDEVGLSEDAFRDLGLAEGSSVRATHARAPESVERVRGKLGGSRLSRRDFDAILADVVERRYSKVELTMFVLACALRRLDAEELVAFTKAMIHCGAQLDFGSGPVADKHCIGGIPGNRTTMVVVPILASLGVVVPKTSSRAITSPSGTADTMAVIVWGGALDLAPADDVLITVERPMGIDTEAQLVASILAKKKTAGATHALIDIPVGPTAKVRTQEQADLLSALFAGVARAIDLSVDVVSTSARGPIGRGVGPRLEALDALSVLRRERSPTPRDTAPRPGRSTRVLPRPASSRSWMPRGGAAFPTWPDTAARFSRRATVGSARSTAGRSTRWPGWPERRRTPPPASACRGASATS